MKLSWVQISSESLTHLTGFWEPRAANWLTHGDQVWTDIKAWSHQESVPLKYISVSLYDIWLFRNLL